MTQAHYIVGDTRDVTATIPDGSIDLVLTSPPFLALRSYLPADHPDKAREIGSEANPAEFLDVLLELTAGWGRVLAPHGSIAIELGDTYSGGHTGRNKANDRPQDGGYANSERVRTEGHRFGIRNMDDKIQGPGEGWPEAKSLALIPELYRIALAYGVNPLTGQPSPAGRWRVRNVVRWHRPNPPVGALGDKYRPATTDMVIACRAKDRWFDLDAVRTPFKGGTPDPAQGEIPAEVTDRTHAKSAGTGARRLQTIVNTHAGAPPLDTWIIPTAPYKGAHYAAFPPKLCEIPVKSMCPLEVCTGCGTPRRRITEDTPELAATRVDVSGARLTVGWTVCDCPTPTYRPGIVLDPFAGTGTTLAVATGHARNAIGIDLDPRNLHLANERIGPLILTHAPHLPNWLTP